MLTALLYAVLYINSQEDTLTEKTLGEVVVSANKFSERKRNVPAIRLCKSGHQGIRRFVPGAYCCAIQISTFQKSNSLNFVKNNLI